MTVLTRGCNACLKPVPFENSVGLEFENWPVDGYVLPKIPAATIKWIRQVNEERFLMNNVWNCVFLVCLLVIMLTVWPKKVDFP